MRFLFYDRSDEISNGIGNAVLGQLDLDETKFGEHVAFTNGSIMVVELNQRIIFTDELVKGITKDPIIFLSRHVSADNVEALTVHPTGNWSNVAEYGGEPKALSVADPYMMANLLRGLAELNTIEFEVTYEATHHGPKTNAPSLFIEAGGPKSINPHAYTIVAQAIVKALERQEEVGEVAMGIGSGHYPSKFTKQALESKYAMSHMMPKYMCDNLDMLGEAAVRSSPQANKALIDWKGLKSSQRSSIISVLNDLGIDHVRI